MNRKYQLAFFSLIWFILLPFPFEDFNITSSTQVTTGTKWLWFGGWHFLQGELAPILPVGAPKQEEWSSQYHYSHYWYSVAFILGAVVLGAASYYLAGYFLKRKPSPKKI